MPCTDLVILGIFVEDIFFTQMYSNPV